MERIWIPASAQTPRSFRTYARSAANACYAATLLEGIWHSEIPADLPSEEVGDLGVPRYSFYRPVLGITPERVRTTFALEVAPVPPEVPEQRGAVHLIETVVRSAS